MFVCFRGNSDLVDNKQGQKILRDSEEGNPSIQFMIGSSPSHAPFVLSTRMRGAKPAAAAFCDGGQRRFKVRPPNSFNTTALDDPYLFASIARYLVPFSRSFPF